jgi:hypothetical protein
LAVHRHLAHWYHLSIMSDESKARVALELCVGDDHEHIIRIEDPDVSPTVGDRIDFANLYNYSVADRSIRFYGSFGPDHQCFVRIQNEVRT